MAETSDLDLLRKLGISIKEKPKVLRTAKEERIIAGFAEINDFFAAHQRLPDNGEDKPIFERLYATRLEQIIGQIRRRNGEENSDGGGNSAGEGGENSKGDGGENSEEQEGESEGERGGKTNTQPDYAALLIESDAQNLLNSAGVNGVVESADEYTSDDELLAVLDLSVTDAGNIRQLRHVKPRAAIRAAEKIAQRTPCPDFAQFKPLFVAVQKELSNGAREARLLQKSPSIEQGDLFVLHGQKVYVAAIGESFVTDNKSKNNRLRVIYDNGTESDLLLDSLQRALEKDATGRRISSYSAGPLFASTSEAADLASGTIYVLRSHSNHPLICKHRDTVHKIGVTGGNIETRIANAKLDPTFLMAEVELVASYELFNINRVQLEGLLHKFFAAVKLNIQIPDRFGNPVMPQEWFLVPLTAIDEVVKRLHDGSIMQCVYDQNAGKIVLED